jgi:hypothetical protein
MEQKVRSSRFGWIQWLKTHRVIESFAFCGSVPAIDALIMADNQSVRDFLAERRAWRDVARLAGEEIPREGLRFLGAVLRRRMEDFFAKN